MILRVPLVGFSLFRPGAARALKKYLIYIMLELITEVVADSSSFSRIF